jgi:hypothetical protein
MYRSLVLVCSGYIRVCETDVMCLVADLSSLCEVPLIYPVLLGVHGILFTFLLKLKYVF